MKEIFNTKSVKRLLNRSTTDLEQSVLVKLRCAREQALARLNARSTTPIFAWAESWFGTGDMSGSHRSHYYWAIAILLMACLFSTVTHLERSAEHHEVSKLDLAILTDDLPLEMYAD